jgi:hypothetical protein
VLAVTYSVHRYAEQGSSDSRCSTSNEPLKIRGFLIPRQFHQLISVCIICIEIDSLKGRSAKNIDKISFPKTFQPLSGCNCLDELKKVLLLTTNYIFQL